MALKSAGFLAMAAAAGFMTPAHAQQQPVPAAPAPAPAAAAAGPRAAKLDPKALLILVRSTMIALDQANKTGNYSVLRDLGSPDFQRGNTLAKLGEIFAGQRNAGLDLGGALVLEPTITLQPQIETNGLLHLAGYFPVNSDGRLNFELFYQFIDKKVQLYGISVNVGSIAAAPAAQLPAGPAQPPAVKAPAATPAPDKPESAKVKPKPKPRPRPKAEPGATPAQ